MTKLEHALALSAMGFWVFRVKENEKLPYAKGWQMEATRDPAKIKGLFEGKNHNIGISTSKFGDQGQGCIAIDEDNKKGKKGADTLLQLDFSGSDVPTTKVQTTPTGGRHHIYVCARPVKQGANVLGDGLDIRSRGGYVVGSGSTIDGVAYTIDGHDVVEAPAWLFAKLASNDPKPKERKEVDVSKINPERALARAKKYLEDAPVAEEGSRNETAFRVICEVKDRGVNQDVCLELILEWNEANEPPLEVEELEITVGSAYKTGQNAVGVKAAEVLFTPVDMPDEEAEKPEDWFSRLNSEFALVIAGGSHHILWEMEDHEGNYKLEHLNEPTFHKMLAYRTVQVGEKRQPETKVWINDREARRYSGIVFAPEQKISPRFFNLWRGFTVKPWDNAVDGMPSEQAKQALHDYLEHAYYNVANGNEEHFRWLIGWFAHLIQKPWQKMLTAPVFKGGKGVGKNALVKPIIELLGSHALLASKKRYLLGQFNSHLESCLLFVLDEAVWGGDKDAEGTVKDVITGDRHLIERKGLEPYTVKNLTNVVAMGNEPWLVAASEDERRFGVYEVNDNRKQDTVFFQSITDGMAIGGLRLLLAYLKSYDLTGINVNIAPKTKGLTGQKIATLDPFGEWWLDCLSTGQLCGASGFSLHTDFKKIDTLTFQNAFQDYAKGRRISARVPTVIAIGKDVAKYAPCIAKKKKSDGGYEYRSPGLAALRRDFEDYLKGKIEWPATEPEESDPYI